MKYTRRNKADFAFPGMKPIGNAFNRVKANPLVRKTGRIAGRAADVGMNGLNILGTASMVASMPAMLMPPKRQEETQGAYPPPQPQYPQYPQYQASYGRKKDSVNFSTVDKNGSAFNLNRWNDDKEYIY